MHLAARPAKLMLAVSLAILAVAVLKAAVFASPALFVVDTPADAVDARAGDGVCRTVAGACTLRAAIQEANALPGADEIELPSGTYELGIRPLNQNDITTGDLDITDSLAITGGGAGSTIVDGGSPPAGAPPQVHGLDRLFEVAVDGGTVSFSGLTLREGSAAEYGGAIVNNSTATVTVSAATLTGNTAGKAGGAIDNHVGGDVDISDSTVSRNFATETGSALNNNRGGAMTVSNSTVSANSAAAVGLDETLAGAGAIANNAELDTIGTITVTDSRIADNRSGGGRPGAISNDGAGSVVVADTTFSKNTAAANGGAIFNGSGQAAVTESTFTENAAADGGAIYSSADKGGFVSVHDSTFVLNSATGNGGAIVGSGSGALEILDSTFSKNSADDWGGAVMNSNQGSATIQRSSFSENSGLNGGGFANEGGGLVTVESSTFTKNRAFVTAVLASGEGGGMHSNSGGEVVVSGGSFTDNTAHGGGGLSNEGGGTISITGTRFASNRADEVGGGILIESGAVRMFNIDVVGNSADSAVEGGGGIAYSGDKVVATEETAALEQSRIRDNKAKGPGGGIDSRGDGPLAITTTSITGNIGAMGGAVHHVGDAPLKVTGSTLSGNFAENGGGVFTDGDGEATVVNTTVSGNRAGQFGGGFLVSSRLHVRNSTVAANTAASGGGINNGGGDLVGDGSVFLANTIVAGSPTGGNCAGTITSLGGNVDSANTCQLRELSDQPGTDPLLGPLASNGGPTQTHALQAGSPAQEKAVCTEPDPCPPVDQRGVERPRFDRFDVGAYESELTPGGGADPRCAGLTERPVPADFDSWVKQASPSANFGTEAILKVESQAGANERALVHFDLPPVPPGCKLVSATLRLYSSSMTDGRTLEAVRLASDWSELGVSWANQPATAGAAASTQSGLETREWDVLEQTRAMYSQGEHGFLIRDSLENAVGEQSFHSGEKGPEHPPELVLVFDDPDAPPLPGSCPTTPQLVSADSDSWVSEGSPTSNFGSDSTLKLKSQIGNNARALIRFPLPILPSGCTSIASATLRVEADAAKEGHTLEALQVAFAWTETGVTWANQPGTTGPAVAIPSAQGPLEWEVTEQLLGMYTTSNHGFLIRDAQEGGVGDEQTLNSRHKATDNPPQLVLAFDDSTPETVIDSGPASTTEETTASFAFSSDRDDATFQCSLDGATFKPCTSPHAVDALSEGDHTLRVRATRRIRAVDPTPASYAWKVAIPPKTTIVDGPASPSDSPDAAVAFTADDLGATFECSLNGAAFERCSSPVEYTNLADGGNEVRVRGTDPLGNVEPTPAAHAWTVAVPPDTTIDTGPPALGNGTSASFEFSGIDNGPEPSPLGFECRLDAGEWASCSSPQRYGGPDDAPLADGRHTFEVRATDAAGNHELEPATRSWTVDTVAPTTTIAERPPELSREAAASFGFDADEPASFECRLDAGEWEACASPQEYSALADGGHTFGVRAMDRAGNLGGAASYAWTVDTVAPTAAIDAGPADPSNDRAPSLEFSAGEAASFECRLDAGEWGACTSPHALSELGDGAHSFHVRATDAAGNRGGAASYDWTVDTAAPVTAIGSRPPEFSKSSSASFEFSTGEEATFECKLDAEDWEACVSGQGYGPLGEGGHAFHVRATDRAGNLGETASHSWTVDTVAPQAAIDSKPSDPSNSSSASFGFSAGEEATFECRLDAGDWKACASGRSYGLLDDGRHTFELRATDTAGNQGSAVSHSWTVDTVAPHTTIGSTPRDPSNDRAPRFEFSADEQATFECKLDAGDWASCTSPHGLSMLGEGGHELRVRATDTAGNTGGAAAYAWTVDTAAPATAIEARPADPTNSGSASFGFSAGEQATFECRLDAGDWAACTSPHALSHLGDGAHSFAVRATDAAGNQGTPASYSWTVDTVAPKAAIDSKPADPSNDRAPSFEFSADEDATFECKLDAAAWAACTSPQGLSLLGDGAHSFHLRATDRAGNQGGAVSYGWTVDTVAPTATIDVGPADPSNDRGPSFEFSAGETATFECKLDAGEWGACTSPHALSELGDGAHSFAVRATDTAGNQGGAASYGWTVDTVAPTTSIDATPSDPSNSSSATFEFSAGEEATFECRLDAGVWERCASPRAYSALGDGQHTFQVRATDVAGNQGNAASYSWTIDTAVPDTTAPETTITESPPTPSNSTSASFSFNGSDNETPQSALVFQCRLDSQAPAAFGPCASPRTYTGLSQGSHTFEVRAVDAAGNADATPASYSWTVDTVAPTTTITSGPAGLTNDSTPTFGFSSEAGVSFQCRVDTAAFAACSSPHTTATLSDGAHTFEVRATDAAGNTGAAASRAISVDTAAPQTTITSGPSGLTNDSTPTFGFSSEAGASFQCRVDAAAFTACSSPNTTATLSDGARTFEVRAIDAAGNTGAAASRAITVDTTGPTTTITSGPSGPTNDSTPTFGFSSEAGGSFQCRVDTTAFAACSSPHTTAVLAAGAHAFEVRATDPAGNIGAAASRSITVDTAAPQTTITNPPPTTTTSTSVTFTFSSNETGSSFECSLDGAAFASCTSPRAYTGLAVGAHTFSVRARDGAGNLDATPATHSWTITAPQQGCGSPVTALAAADAWIDENSPTSNKGTDSVLKVQSKGPRDNFRALVRFTLPAVPQGCVVESATLRLFTASAKTPRTLQALRLTAAWTENLVNWSNQPQTTGAAATTAAGTGYREWTVTSQAQAMYLEGNHGFLIRDAVEAQDAEQQLHSREKGQNPPQLVVRFAPAGG
jgi:CSLREA domain-containing protein